MIRPPAKRVGQHEIHDAALEREHEFWLLFLNGGCRNASSAARTTNRAGLQEAAGQPEPRRRAIPVVGTHAIAVHGVPRPTGDLDVWIESTEENAARAFQAFCELCAQKRIVTVRQDEVQARSIVALDPGVRAFVTDCSVNHAASYGEGFYTDKLFPLLLQLDRLAGRRAKARCGEWKRHYRKRIDRLAIRVRNLDDDLHRRVVHDLVQAFDVILLPSFETKGMSAKEDRRIRTKTVRSMLGLAHYRFRRKLEWMCRKYGKRLIVANKAYTSRTRSWDGFANEHIGGARTVSDGKIVVDGDMNGARGIMLRAPCGNLGHFRAAGDDVALVAE